MSLAREFLTGIVRPNEDEMNLNNVARVGVIVARSGIVGFRLEPEREIARLSVTAYDSVPLIRDAELEDEEKARSFFARYRQPARRITNLPLFLTPSADVSLLYLADFRLDCLVRTPSEIDVKIWSPDPLTVRTDLPVDTDLRKLVAELNRSRRRR